jgi:TatD DNase family protein
MYDRRADLRSMLIDTHSHLYADQFKEDQKDVIQRLQDSDVGHVVLPNIDVNSIEALLELVDKDNNVFLPMMGLHPCSVGDDYKTQLETIYRYFISSSPVAVGEIGLDFHWDMTYKKQQIEALHTQMVWAEEHNLPVALHTRKATWETLEVVKRYPDVTGIFHCFGDGIEEAEAIIDAGYLLGIGGVVTFKNSGLSEVLKNIDLKHIVLETDSPYLAPTPHRGKRNESSYVRLVADKLAQVKGISYNEVAEKTTENARRLFGIRVE